MNKQQWLLELNRIFTKYHGPPKDDKEKKNIEDYLENIYQYELEISINEKEPIVFPLEAYDNEMSCS